MPGPQGATTTPVGGGIVSSSLFGIPTAIANQNYAENQWVDYSSTFVWGGAGGTGPTKGTSLYSARYLWVHPRLVKVQWRMLLQSGWANGTGAWILGLPIQAIAADGNGATGSWAVWPGGGTIHIGTLQFNTALAVEFRRQGDGSPFPLSTPPSFTPGNAYVRASIDFEPL